MMIYLLDTNCVLAYLRKNELAQQIDRHYNPFATDNIAILSAVVVGELHSITQQSHWGENRIEELTEFVKLFKIFGINYVTILQRYAQIDAFSQNKLIDKPLGMSARNMGKNDLWIAATASVMEATLITTDKDFGHLHNQFVDVVWINPDLAR